MPNFWFPWKTIVRVNLNLSDFNPFAQCFHLIFQILESSISKTNFNGREKVIWFFSKKKKEEKNNTSNIFHSHVSCRLCESDSVGTVTFNIVLAELRCPMCEWAETVLLKLGCAGVWRVPKDLGLENGPCLHKNRNALRLFLLENQCSLLTFRERENLQIESMIFC